MRGAKLSLVEDLRICNREVQPRTIASALNTAWNRDRTLRDDVSTNQKT